MFGDGGDGNVPAGVEAPVLKVHIRTYYWLSYRGSKGKFVMVKNSLKETWGEVRD